MNARKCHLKERLLFAKEKMSSIPQIVKDQMIDGHKIVRPYVAKGASSVVHEAIDPEGRKCALKILVKPSDIDEKLYQKLVKEFKSEYQNLIGIRHPNVAEAYHFGYFENQFYFSSEFVKGKHLLDYLRGVEPEEMVQFFVQCLEGLDFIHRNGLLHLDIKSENIIVQTGGRNPRLKIIDFGVALGLDKYNGAFCGSPSYIAPEVAFGKSREVDARADLFSFGVLMYLCLTWGKHPFKRFMAKGDFKKVREIVEKEVLPKPPTAYKIAAVPDYLSEITMRLIAKDPNERFYTNARSVVNAMLTHSPDEFSDLSETRGLYLLPAGDKHIGREGVQLALRDAVESLSGGAYPETKFPEYMRPVICISGARGLGKTHLYEKVCAWATEKVENVYLSSISFPAAETNINLWMEDLNRRLSDNERGTLILVDNFDEIESEEVATFIKNIARHIVRCSESPELYTGIKPAVLIFTSKKLPKLGAGIDGKLTNYNLSKFSPEELKEYLKATPAFKDKEIPEKWLKGLYYHTSGIPAEIQEHLTQMDMGGLLFDMTGDIIVTGVGDPSITMEHEYPPETTRERLLLEYEKLPHTEKGILKLMAVWNRLGLTRPITYNDVENFLYIPALVQNMENLQQNGIIIPRTSEVCNLTLLGGVMGGEGFQYFFTNSYFPTLIYEQIPKEECELMHDQIAGYLKTDQDAILLHKGYGSKKLEAVRSLIFLSRDQMYHKGRAKLAHTLLESALEIVKSDGAKLEKLTPYIYSLLFDASYYCGIYSEILDKFNEAATALDGGDQNFRKLYWRLRLNLSWIRTLIVDQKFDEAEELIKKSLQICKKYKLKEMKILFENYHANCLYGQSFKKPKKAKKLLDNAEHVYEETLDEEAALGKQVQSRVLNNDLGVVLRSLGKYNEAVIRLTDKLGRLNAADMIFDKMETLVTLADICRYTKDYGSAEDFGRKALEIARKTKNDRWLTYSNQVLVNIFHSEDKFYEALQAANRCIAAGAVLANTDEYEHLLHRLRVKEGHCYKEMKEYNKAIQFFEAAITGNSDDVYSMSSHVGLGEVYYYKKDFKKSLQHLDEAEKLLGTFPDPSHMKRITELKKLIARKVVS